MRVRFSSIRAQFWAILRMLKGFSTRSAVPYIALILMSILIITTDAHADELEVKNEKTYGRLIMKFDSLPGHSISTQNGIVVMSFDKPTNLSANEIPVILRDMVMAARKDPDGKAIRLAMSKKIKMNVIEAYDTLYVDLLPEPWNKPMPGLPIEAVAQLNKKLEEAAKKARDKALRDEQKRNPATVNIRVGEHPTFTRLAFDWSRRIPGHVSRDGEAHILHFAYPAKVDLARLKAEMPSQMQAIETSSDEYEMRVKILVQPGVELYSFEEGATFVVDLMGSVSAEKLNEIKDDAKKQELTDASKAATQYNEKVIRLEDPAAKGNQGGIQMVVPVTKETSGFAKLTSQTFNMDGTEGDDLEAPLSAKTAIKNGKENSRSSTADTNTVQTEVRKVGQNMRLLFPFTKETSAAIFARGQYVWLIFDNPVPIETRAIRTEMREFVENIDHQRMNTTQILRLQLKKPMLLSAISEGSAWAVTLGDMILTPSTPLLFERSNFADGRAFMRLAMQKTGQLHVLDDPIVGDKLNVVTLPGPAQGMLRMHEFVEFSAITTAHGAVIRPKTDDLNVQVSTDNVLVSRESGLNISTDKGAMSSASNDGGTASVQRTGFIDFTAWKIDGPDSYFPRLRSLIAEAGRETGKDKTNRRLNVARFYLANEMAEEALGVLTMTKEAAPDVERDQSFRVLRAVANFYARRYKDAIEDLALPEFDKSQDVAMWRGLSYAGLKDWRPAQLNLVQALSGLAAYPPKLQVQAMLIGARSSLEVRDVQQAEQFITQIDPRSLTPKTSQDKALLEGWASEYLGNIPLAQKQYGQAIIPLNLAAEAEARLRLVTMMLNSGELKPDAALNELESLSMSWRGDEVELRTLSVLARQHAKSGRYRRAFETTRTAVAANAGSDITRLLQDDMQEVFVGLFLEDKDKDMKALDALSIFYDFKDLVPVGSRGDEVIRVLSGRLVDVELFGQAIELLAYQVDKRLSGAQKADVASTLAMVHLMNHEPQEALNVLRRSRQAILAHTLERRRLLLEVSALSELGQHDLALELLKTPKGDDIERIKADILWKSQRWQQAAETLELLLDKRWQVEEALNEQERTDILRTAVGYALQGDNLGLARFRGKFSKLMGDSPDAQAYEMVTRSADSQNYEFRAVARRLASADTLGMFLKEFRAQSKLKLSAEKAKDIQNETQPASAISTDGKSETDIKGEKKIDSTSAPANNNAPASQTLPKPTP